MSEDLSNPAPPVGAEHRAPPPVVASDEPAPLSVDMTSEPGEPEAKPRDLRAGLPRIPTAVALAALVAFVALVELLPTLRLSYAYDDLDCLNLAADVIAGRRGYLSMALMPHNEHLMPVLRAVFHASASWFGVNPVPFRL